MGIQDHGLSPLQQELFDELVDDYLDGMPPEIADKEGLELARNISTMNAAELRHNISVFKNCK